MQPPYILYDEIIRVPNNGGHFYFVTSFGIRLISCTNALRKVPSVHHRVLSFCINTLRETKGALIGVNSVVLGIVDTR